MTAILLINDTTDHDNWGSVAGAEALKEIIIDAVPDIRMETIPSSWTTARFKVVSERLGGWVYSGRNRLLDRFARPFYFVPSVADEFELVAQDWLNGKGGKATDELLVKLNSTDVVVFHAEGSTYRTNASAVRCLFTLWLAKTQLGKRALFLNGSVTLTEVDPVLPAMVAKTFRVLDGVAIREPCSLRNVQRWVPDVPVELVPDSVFYLEPKSCVGLSGKARAILTRLEGRPYFCLSLSMLLSMQAGYMRWGAGPSSLLALIERLRGLGLEAVLLARDGMDQAIVQRLAGATGALCVGPDFHYRDVQGVFSNAAFLVSGRYHHLILAATVGCPGIALRTSSHKVDGLCELFEGELGRAYDPTDLWSNLDVIVERARSILDDDRLRDRVKNIARQLRLQSLRLGQMVRNAAVQG